MQHIYGNFEGFPTRRFGGLGWCHIISTTPQLLRVHGVSWELSLCPNWSRKVVGTDSTLKMRRIQVDASKDILTIMMKHVFLHF